MRRSTGVGEDSVVDVGVLHDRVFIAQLCDDGCPLKQPVRAVGLRDTCILIIVPFVIRDFLITVVERVFIVEKLVPIDVLWRSVDGVERSYVDGRRLRPDGSCCEERIDGDDGS